MQRNGGSGPASISGRDLPRMVEVKRTLTGREKRFECGVLRHEGSHLVVLFVAPTAMHVHGVDLPEGTVTFGHFWTDRPYNVYHWLDHANGTTLGYYMNLSGETTVANGRLDWLDLVVDILVSPDGRITVLDEDEIPDSTSDALRTKIAQARTAALRETGALMAELERDRAALWPPPNVAKETGR